MNEHLLALYMGYALCHGIDVQHRLAADELTVPYVIYWNDETPTTVPYPAATQAEAVAKAQAARESARGISGWSAGREALVPQSDGTKFDAILIEGFVPGLNPPLQMFVYYRKNPFRLLYGFFWQQHPTARKDPKSFMVEFQRGVRLHPYGQQCINELQNAERVTFTR